MNVKEVEVSYGVTRNMGNYESLRLDYTVRGELELPDKDTDALLKAMRKTLRERVDKAIQEEVAWLGRRP